MTTFTLMGHRGQDIVQITWTDGVLSGDTDGCRIVEWYAQTYEGEFVSGILASGTTTDHLKDAWTSYNLMHLAFTDTPLVTAGALPEIALPPKGSVI